eukprot:scpid17400/ scgid35737/ 
MSVSLPLILLQSCLSPASTVVSVRMVVWCLYHVCMCVLQQCADISEIFIIHIIMTITNLNVLITSSAVLLAKRSISINCCTHCTACSERAISHVSHLLADVAASASPT